MTISYPDPMTVPYEFIDTTEGFLAVLNELNAAAKIAIDTETEVIEGSDLDKDGPGDWCVTSIAARFSPDPTSEMKVWVVDMTNINTPAIAPAAAALESYSWNASFERLVFERDGVSIAKWIDLMHYQATLDQGTYQGNAFYMGLAASARKWLDVDLEGKGSIQLSYKRGVPLSDEQKAYAAQDAIVALWLVDVLEPKLVEDGLLSTALRECAAQHYIDLLKRNGLAFDAEGWRHELANQQVKADEALARLADLTTGSQITLFGPSGVPDWNPDSTPDVKRILNQFEPDRVRAYQEHWGKAGSATLTPEDQADKSTLQLIGGPIVEALLEYRARKKMISTYGEPMLALLWEDGRFHSRYLQNLTNTGRLSSDKPNAQNMAPESKRYTRPPSRRRVLVCADFSQAELRLLAQITGDIAMLTAFREGKDLHVVTAGRMFSVDMAELSVSDPALYTAMRKKAKTLNFGIVYGLGARSLAIRLTVEGVDTTVAEAKELLKRYLEVYPQVSAWLNARDTYVKSISENLGAVDWQATWELLSKYKLYNSAYWKVRKAGGVPSWENIAAEVAAATRNAGSEDMSQLVASPQDAKWALSFKGPVVLADRSTPFQFESRTPAGRRRLFHVSADMWLSSMVLLAGASRKPRPTQVREEWAAKNNQPSLCTKNGGPLSWGALSKRFENKALKLSFVSYVLERMPEAAEYLMRTALADCIRQKSNEFRNHPIQGGVGDAVLDAFALLDARLGQFHNAIGVQSVHDSIVVECDLEEAPQVAEVVKASMLEAMEAYCPDLPIKVDVDIQRSLDAKYDIIESVEAELAAIAQDPPEPLRV